MSGKVTVFLKFAGKVLSSKAGQAQQQSYLNDVAKFIQVPGNASQAKAKATGTVVITDPKHSSTSWNKQPHSSIAAYDASGNLVLGGHVDAQDPTKGEFFVPKDPNYIAKWGTLKNANPSAGGQKEDKVDI